MTTTLNPNLNSTPLNPLFPSLDHHPHYPISPTSHHAPVSHNLISHKHNPTPTPADPSTQTFTSTSSVTLERDRYSSSSTTTTLENQGLSPSTSSKTNSMSLDLDVEDEEDRDRVDGVVFKVPAHGDHEDDGLITPVEHPSKLIDSERFRGVIGGHLNHRVDHNEDEVDDDQTIEVYPFQPPLKQQPSINSRSVNPDNLPGGFGLGLNFGTPQDHPQSNHIHSSSHHHQPYQQEPIMIRRRGSSLPSSDPVIPPNEQGWNYNPGVGRKMVVPPLTVEAPTPIVDEVDGTRTSGVFEDGPVGLGSVEQDDGMVGYANGGMGGSLVSASSSSSSSFEHRDLKVDSGLEEGFTYPIMMNGIYDTTHGPTSTQHMPELGADTSPRETQPGLQTHRTCIEAETASLNDREPPSPFSQPIRLGQMDRALSADSGLSVSTFGSDLTAKGKNLMITPDHPGSGSRSGFVAGLGVGSGERRYPLGPLHSPSSGTRTSGSHLPSPVVGGSGGMGTGNASLGSRRMSRKQAPVLTESLENLALGGSEVTLPSVMEGMALASDSRSESRSGVAIEVGRIHGLDVSVDDFGTQAGGSGLSGVGDRGMTPTNPARLFTVYPDPALPLDGDEDQAGPDPSGWLKDHSMEKSPTLSFSRLARIGSRGTGARSPTSPSTAIGLPVATALTGRTISMVSSAALASGPYTTVSGRRASAGGIEPSTPDGGVERESKKRHSSFLGLGPGNVGFGVRRRSEAGLIEESGIAPSHSTPIESPPRTIKPARALSPRLLMVPLISRHKSSMRNGQDRKPPVIPTRQDSLPVDPASARGLLGNNPSGGASGLSGGSGSMMQLPLDHFLFGQTRGDVISTVTSNDARRPSEQTFMTGYSLGGGAIASTDDESHGLAGPQTGQSKTIDLGDESDDARGFASPLPPSSSARASTADMLQPSLFTKVSASAVTVATTTSMTRPRDDLPFGVSRKDPSSSGPPTPSEFLTDGFSTPRPMNLTPSSSFLRKDRPNIMYANELGEHSKRSVKTTTINRRPVQWAELDALEEEEARMRAEMRREERSRRVEEKKEKKKVKRQGLAKKLAGGSRTGYSTDTSSDGTKSKREGFRERRARLKQESEVFDALKDTIPGYDDLMAASMIQVRDETGTKIEFGQLVSAGLGKRYVVIFIRHWYCPLCAQYTDSIIRTIDQEALDRARVELIIIGNGSYKMIPGYSKSIKCPFKMYTDSKLKLYRALGMTRQTGDAGNEDEKGDYIRMSTLESTWEVAKRASKMPIKNPGHFTQIGGEFIFSGPTECTYAHRMSNTRNHAPIRDIVALAGVRLDFYHGDRGSPPPAIHRPELNENTQDGMTFGNWGESGISLSAAERYAMESRRESEGDGWLVAREEELERVRLARQGRRSNAGLEGGSGGGACMPQIMSDSEAEVEGYVPRDRPSVQRVASRFVEMMDPPNETKD